MVPGYWQYASVLVFVLFGNSLAFVDRNCDQRGQFCFVEQDSARFRLDFQPSARSSSKRLVESVNDNRRSDFHSAEDSRRIKENRIAEADARSSDFLYRQERREISEQSRIDQRHVKGQRDIQSRIDRQNLRNRIDLPNKRSREERDSNRDLRRVDSTRSGEEQVKLTRDSQNDLRRQERQQSNRRLDRVHLRRSDRTAELGYSRALNRKEEEEVRDRLQERSSRRSAPTRSLDVSRKLIRASERDEPRRVDNSRRVDMIRGPELNRNRIEREIRGSLSTRREELRVREVKGVERLSTDTRRDREVRGSLNTRREELRMREVKGHDIDRLSTDTRRDREVRGSLNTRREELRVREEKGRDVDRLSTDTRRDREVRGSLDTKREELRVREEKGRNVDRLSTETRQKREIRRILNTRREELRVREEKGRYVDRLSTDTRREREISQQDRREERQGLVHREPLLTHERRNLLTDARSSANIRREGERVTERREQETRERDSRRIYLMQQDNRKTRYQDQRIHERTDDRRENVRDLRQSRNERVYRVREVRDQRWVTLDQRDRRDLQQSLVTERLDRRGEARADRRSTSLDIERRNEQRNQDRRLEELYRHDFRKEQKNVRYEEDTTKQLIRNFEELRHLSGDSGRATNRHEELRQDVTREIAREDLRRESKDRTRRVISTRLSDQPQPKVVNEYIVERSQIPFAQMLQALLVGALVIKTIMQHETASKKLSAINMIGNLGAAALQKIKTF